MKEEIKKDPEKIRRIMKISKIYGRTRLGMESVEDRVAVKNEVKKAKGKRARPVKNLPELKKLQRATVVRYDTGELVVITKTKLLVSYILTITDKSPKKYRWSLVGKLHNSCLDALEALFKANVVKNKGPSKELRSSLQLEAYSKLKMVGYFALISMENECITKKQFEHISMLVSDAINLLFAWKRSDDNKDYRN